MPRSEAFRAPAGETSVHADRPHWSSLIVLGYGAKLATILIREKGTNVVQIEADRGKVQLDLACEALECSNRSRIDVDVDGDEA